MWKQHLLLTIRKDLRGRHCFLLTIKTKYLYNLKLPHGYLSTNAAGNNGPSLPLLLSSRSIFVAPADDTYLELFHSLRQITPEQSARPNEPCLI